LRNRCFRKPFGFAGTFSVTAIPIPR
jgi:hypothetical protein